MNFRFTAILFGLLLVLVIVLIGVTFLDDTPTVTGTVFEEFVGVKPEQIDTVEIERADPAGKLVLIRVGKDKWEVQSPVKAKADSHSVESLVSSLLSAKPTVTPETSRPLSELGLQSPSLKVMLRKGSDQTGTLNVGTITIGENKALAFVSTAKHPDRAMALKRVDLDGVLRDDAKKSTGEPAGKFAKWTADFRTMRPIGPDVQMAATQTQSLAIASKGKTIKLANENGTWKIEEPALGSADVAGDATPTPNLFTGVRPLLGAITGLQAVSAKDFIEAPKDLKEFGLNADNPDLVKVELKTTDGGTDIAYIGSKVKDEPGKVYVKLEGDPDVFKANAVNIDGLAAVVANPATLRDRNVLAVEKPQIDAIDLMVNGQTTKLRRTASGWNLYGGPHDPQPANELAVNSLIELLAEKRTIKDFPPANAANFAPNEVKAEVKVYADAVGPNADPSKEPDLKGKKPTVLTFGKKEGNAITVRREKPDGTTMEFTLPETVAVGTGKAQVKLIDTIAKTRGDFINLQLKSFVAAVASKLSYTRSGGETVGVSKSNVLDPQYPRGRWAFDKPDSRKGQPANADKIFTLLEDLASLSANKVVDEQPSEEKLKSWGLDPKSPKLKVTVTLDTPDDKERTYDFGNEVDGFVYARVANRSEAFLVSKYAVERFGPSADLRDPTVATFDRTRVKGLKIRGWWETNKVVTTLELEKKDGKWSAKAPPGFVPDSAKVEQLITAIYHARAKAFVGPNKPEYGFAVESQKGLEITIELDGGLPAVVVNIGAEADGGASYYVYCNQHPDDIETVATDAFKAFKEKSASLAK